MKYTLNFYLENPDKDYSSQNVKTIYYYITWSGQRLRKSTKEKCRQCDWIESDKKGKVQRVNKKLDYAINVNSRLTDIEYNIDKLFSSNKTPSDIEIISAIEGTPVSKLEFKDLYRKFIDDSKSGERVSKKGKRIKKLTYRSYEHAFNILERFEKEKKFKLKWENINDKFYNRFTNYMWDDLNYYDNSVGSIIKEVRTFLNWCEDEKYISKAPHNSSWVVWEEEIDMVVLYPDELNILFNADPETERLQRTKDIFLAGCMTCLRVSNLLSLKKEDLTGNKLKIISVKIDKPIFLDVPPMLMKIFKKYDNLLPQISQQKFNEALKDLAVWMAKYIKDNKKKLKKDFVGNDWTKDVMVTRYKRGEPIQIPTPITEMITSHTMRRTGITNLLMMGLSEIEVKSISGHSLSSKDFGKYVKIAERFISNKSNSAWGAIAKK